MKFKIIIKKNNFHYFDFVGEHNELRCWSKEICDKYDKYRIIE